MTHLRWSLAGGGSQWSKFVSTLYHLKAIPKTHIEMLTERCNHFPSSSSDLLFIYFFHLPSLRSIQRPDISRALSISGDHDPFPGPHPADYVIHPGDDGDFWKTHDCILKVLCFLQCLSGHTKNTFTSTYCQLFFFLLFPYTNFSHLPHQPTNGGSLIQESRDDVLPPVIPVFSSLGKKKQAWRQEEKWRCYLFHSHVWSYLAGHLRQ